MASTGPQQQNKRQLERLGAPQDLPATNLYGDKVEAHLTEAERKALGADLNRRILAHHRFHATSIATNATTRGAPISWNELRDEIRMNAVFSSRFTWPSSVCMDMVTKNGLPTFSFSFFFGEKPASAATGGTSKTLDLASNERIDTVRISKSTVSGKEVISYVYIRTNTSKDKFVGTQPDLGTGLEEFEPPSGCAGLIFFVATEKHDSAAIGKLLLAWK